MINQIIKAVNEVYLKEVMNPTTSTILNDMPTVLLHLFTNYGMIECEDLAVQAKNVAESGYNIADHITNLFSKVEDPGKFAIATNDPYMATKLVNIRLNLIKSTNDFIYGLKE